ncbi:MAG: TadE/TadG family type IV pilus assembly protein [Pseudomonadota bacterium]
MTAKNRKLRRRRTLSAFWKNESGSYIVEFAIILPIFLALMASIFEVGWFHFVNSTVGAAATKGARIVRTGQAQLGNMDKDEFYQRICDVVDTFDDCSQALTVDVATFADFAALAADTSSATCADGPPAEVSNIPYDPGGEGAIVRVRICFIYETFNPAIGVQLAGADGKRHITSTVIFRNEPYEKNNRDSV